MTFYCEQCDEPDTDDNPVDLRDCGHVLCEDCAISCDICAFEEEEANKDE
jgi:hypothetical protein